MYEVTVGVDVYYADATGRYLLRGSLVDLDSRHDLTAPAKARAVVSFLGTLDPADAIVFSPPHPTHTIDVFVDVDCAYCQKFHAQAQAYNDQGVAIRYYPWPRAGTSGAGYQKMVSVWCAPDRQRAFSTAITGGVVKPLSCSNSVAKYYRLGRSLGIEGTPGIFLDNGVQIGGYVSPDRMPEEIRQAIEKGR